ncbi:MAG: hypothetical protein PHU33_15050 [Bacteroidales bacterium]|nr:hypothetical protein [Bacteroidales bacterium]
MEEKYKQYEKTIKKKHSFAWTPKYASEFTTRLSAKEFIAIAEKTFKDLGWDIVYQDDKSIEAKRSEKSLGTERWTEGITATFEYGKIQVKSVTLGNEMWDVGRNSKRVQLFIYAFQETEKSFDREELQNLVSEKETINNWDDYVVPDSLPKPDEVREPKFYIHIVGCSILTILIAFLLAKVSISGFYIIGLFEFLVGFIIGFTFKYLFKFSNFTNYDKLHYVILGTVGLTYLLNQYFQYEIILFENNYDRIGFFEFLKIKFEQGLTIKKLNTGWIGLLVHWILQLVITYYVTVMTVIRNLTKYQLDRVPPEVVDFAFYHFVKDKTEDQVRKELTLKGWTETQNQDEVFEAIGALQTTQDVNRMQ